MIEIVRLHNDRPPVHVVIRRRYKLHNFFWDLFMIAISGGLWLIWIFIREMRKQY